MSLRVWLPLTKDLRNQGLDDVIVTNNGAVYSASGGKLGGYYTGHIDISSSVIPTILNNTEFTVTFWIYIDEVPPGSSVSDTYVMACGAAGTRTQFHIAIRQNGAGFAFCFYSDDYTFYNTVTDKVGKWMHIVCAFKNNTQIVYVDGTKIGERATAGGLNIAANRVLNIYAAHERLNDFRLYDHCLSPMEIKQISQGLILHYPLNRGGWGQENLLSKSITDFSNWTNINADCVTLSSNGYNNKFLLVKGVGGKWENAYSPAIQVTSGKEYTLSCNYKIYSTYNYTSSYGEFGLTVMKAVPTNANPINNTIARIGFPNIIKEGRKSITFIPTTDTIYLNMCGGSIVDGQTNKEFDVNNIKLEEGSIATPWCPNSTDELATTMGLNDNVEYDCSGFCNNGTRTGTFSWISDTPKYNVSTGITAGGGIFTPMNITFLQYTIAFWAKHTVKSKMLMGSCPSAGIAQTSWYWYGDNSFKYPSGEYYYTHNGGAQDSFKWTHFVATYDGANVRVYRNGVSEGSKACTGDQVMAYLSIGYGYGSQYTENSDMSDFRIYATALSAEDVKDLYELGATIDTNGTLSTYEFTEQ